MIMRRNVLKVAGGLSAALVLAACSSSSHSSAPPASTKTSAAPITVGVICSCSGTLGSNDVAKQDVYRAWVNTVDASGGIDGHQVKLITKDDAGVPGTAVSEAQGMVSDHVDAILDISNVDTAWATEVQQADIPVVGSNVFDTPFYTNPDFYSEGQTADSSFYSVVATAKLAGADNLGIVYCAEAAACEDVISPTKQAGKKLGVPVNYVAEISATAPNYTAQCLAAEQAHISAIFIADVPTVVQNVGHGCSEQGYNPTWVTEGSSFDMLQTTTAGIKDNLWSEFSDMPFFSTTPEVEAMDTAVDKYYPGLRNNTTEWSQLAALSWPSGLLLEDAVKAGGLSATGTPSAAEVVKGLHSLHSDTLDGWAPPLTFTAGKANPVDCWFTSHVKDGTPSLVDNGKVSCESGSAS